MEKDFIAKRFVSIRTAKNMSARNLSIELGQSAQYINQIESGRKMPSVDGLFRFCEYFNISLKDFFEDEYSYPIQYKDLFKNLNKLDIDELNEIILIVNRIVKNKK